MTISIDKNSSKNFRKALRVALPNIKSAHVAEALAAALGYRTNASLLAAFTSNEAGFPIGDSAAVVFSSRLSELSGGDPASAEASFAKVMATLKQDGPVSVMPLGSSDRHLVYRLISSFVRDGYDNAGAFSLVIAEVSKDEEFLSLVATLSEAVKRCKAGASLSDALEGMVPATHRLLIQWGEKAGYVEFSLMKAAKLSNIPPGSQRHARALLIRILSYGFQMGFTFHFLLKSLLQHPWELDGPTADYLRDIAHQAFVRVSDGKDLGEAFRDIFPKREWLTFGMFANLNDFDVSLRAAANELEEMLHQQ